jgi:dethiobiotin synthetase
VPDLLVTGTDTGVGKTIIAAALIKALRARGVRALGFKPAETGSPSDSDLLARASGESTPLATPLLQLGEPLAPAVAADRAGAAIHPFEIEERVGLLRRAGYTLVVEGAGGVMAPLAWENEKGSPVYRHPEQPHSDHPHSDQPRSDQPRSDRPHPFYTVLDLAAHCGLEAIVVGRPGLGTLSHIAMTVAMLRARNVPVKAVILNGRRPSAPGPEPLALSPEPLALSPEPDLAESTNPAALARMLPGMRIIEVPCHGAPSTLDALATIDATVPYLTPLLP